MTKKDYIAIAAVIAESPMLSGQRESIVDSLADIMQADNPAFNRATFERACFANAATLES